MSGNDLSELLGIPAASDSDKVEVRLNVRFLPTVEALIQRIKKDACPGLGDLSDQCCASLAALEEMVQEVDRLRAQLERVQGAHELTAAWDKASIVNALANIRDTDASAKTLREIAGRALSAVELEDAFECREFAKLYRFAGLGQVLVVLDTSGGEKADALITFQFWPGVEGLGVCSTYLGFMDGDSGTAADKAEEFFAGLTAEAAERIVGETAQKIREGCNYAEEMNHE